MAYEKLLEYYKKAAENAKTNPDAAVSNARKAAEQICKNIIDESGNDFNPHASIEDLLKQIRNRKIRIDPKLELTIRTIQVYANYGAHDQSYKDSMAAELRFHDDLTNNDVIPCMNAFKQMLNIFIEGDPFAEENFGAEFSGSSELINGYNVRIGVTSLTVPDSIMQGWQCDEIFSRLGMKTQRIARKWNDQILDDLVDDTLDLAIYNKESILRYIDRNPDADIHMIKDVCSSMGGRNFYILASNDGRWTDMTLQQFKEALGPGVVFAVSRNSDMEKNLLYILDMSMDDLIKTGVKIFDYHSDSGLSIFDLNPDALVIGGQDLRFLAEKQGGYTEVISYENLPVEKRDFFIRNSINSLVVGPRLYHMLPDDQLETLANRLMINFYSNNISETSRKSIRNKLRPQVRQICSDNETADYIIDRIMFETYRFF